MLIRIFDSDLQVGTRAPNGGYPTKPPNNTFKWEYQDWFCIQKGIQIMLNIQCDVSWANIHFDNSCYSTISL